MDISSEPPTVIGDTVKLISSDKFEFIIPRDAALVSGTLRGMLSTGFLEATSGKVELENIAGSTLELVCDYLLYNMKYKDQIDVPEFPIPPEMALELLVAADFLDSK